MSTRPSDEETGIFLASSEAVLSESEMGARVGGMGASGSGVGVDDASESSNLQKSFWAATSNLVGEAVSDAAALEKDLALTDAELGMGGAREDCLSIGDTERDVPVPQAGSTYEYITTVLDGDDGLSVVAAGRGVVGAKRPLPAADAGDRFGEPTEVVAAAGALSEETAAVTQGDPKRRRPSMQ